MSPRPRSAVVLDAATTLVRGLSLDDDQAAALVYDDEHHAVREAQAQRDTPPVDAARYAQWLEAQEAKVLRDLERSIRITVARTTRDLADDPPRVRDLNRALEGYANAELPIPMVEVESMIRERRRLRSEAHAMRQEQEGDRPAGKEG